MIFSIETLHNNFFDKPSFSEEQYKLFKTQKKESFKLFDELFLDKLNSCLSSFNRISLKERLLDLIN